MRSWVCAFRLRFCLQPVGIISALATKLVLSAASPLNIGQPSMMHKQRSTEAQTPGHSGMNPKGRNIFRTKLMLDTTA